METTYLTFILVSLLFSAFFSGIEIAFVSADKLHFELQRHKGGVSGFMMNRYLKDPSVFIGTTLIGNTIALVVYGIFMAKALEPTIWELLPQPIQNEVILMLVQTIASTMLVLATAEFLPKSLFMLNPNGFVAFFSLPMMIIYYIFYPMVFLVVSLSKITLKNIFRLKYEESQPVFGLTDLNNFIKNTSLFEHQENKVEVNKQIFNNALEFKTVKVRECMIPRTEVEAIEINDNIENLRKLFSESGHSKIIVYKETIDDVIGYCHSLAMFKKPKDIASVLNPIVIVPETMPANELMVQFITERKSLALIVDEFGGTAGIVSIEDIIEEIFGEIQDEHDDEDFVEKQINEETYLLSARLEIDYLNEKYHFNIPDGDYDTLGGFILSIKENFPSQSEVIDHSSFTFIIESMEDNRIDLVRLILNNSNN